MRLARLSLVAAAALTVALLTTPVARADGSPRAPAVTLTGVAAISPTDAWAVGYKTSGDTTHTLIEHYDGASWTKVASPNPGGGYVNALTAVTAIGPNDVWAVGYFLHRKPQLPLRQGKTLTLHWDGTSWTQIPSGNLEPYQWNRLSAVSAASSDDVWAVGFRWDHGGFVFPVAIHWDGTAWTMTKARIKHTTSGSFTCVADLGADDAIAMGTGAAFSEQWTGGKFWLQGAAPGISVVNGLSDSAASNIWAVGQGTAHFNGTSWGFVRSPLRGELTAVSTLPTVAMAVGDGAEVWNGTKWSTVSTAPGQLSAVTLDSATDGWAVGDNAGTPVIEHWNGSDFS